MTDEKKPRPDFEEEEIEILEVIGLDEDSPAARPRPARRDGQRAAADTVVELEDRQAPQGDERVTPDKPASTDLAQQTSESDLAVRLAADFESLKQRVEREREATERHAAARLIERLLPVLDNFERALSASSQPIGPGFREGIALIFRHLLEELRKEGLTAVDTVGEPFDPAVHEAVATTRDCDLPPHTVVEELQRGYLLHQRLLRPALVRVTLDPDPEPGGAGKRGEG